MAFRCLELVAGHLVMHLLTFMPGLLRDVHARHPLFPVDFSLSLPFVFLPACRDLRNALYPLCASRLTRPSQPLCDAEHNLAICGLPVIHSARDTAAAEGAGYTARPARFIGRYTRFSITSIPEPALWVYTRRTVHARATIACLVRAFLKKTHFPLECAFQLQLLLYSVYGLCSVLLCMFLYTAIYLLATVSIGLQVELTRTRARGVSRGNYVGFYVPAFLFALFLFSENLQGEQTS